MKKKKVILIIVLFLVLVCIRFIMFIYKDYKVVTTITLDINPSIEINLNTRDEVIRVVPLNEDANKLVSADFEGKTLDDTLNIIVDKLIENDYIHPNDLVDVISYSNGNITNDKVNNIVSKTMGDRNIPVSIINVVEVTKEDEELSKKYNVSPAKVAYIKTITEEKENIEMDDLANKSVSEIKETKDTGKYCEKGWILEGDFCLKEIQRYSASSGEVCPPRYTEIDGKCYEETGLIDSGELVCNDGLKLIDGKCYFKEEVSAFPSKYSCSTGELVKSSDYSLSMNNPNVGEYACIDKSKGQEPVLRCLKNPGHIMIGGKCYNGPAPLINGGCPGNDKVVNGKCYSLDDEDQWQCPNGGIYHKSQNSVPKLCPDTLKVYKATVTEYRCDGNFELQGNKCVLERVEDPRHVNTCPSGFTKTNNDRCVNYSNSTTKQDGYVCTGENTRINGKDCVVYEIDDVKR